MRCIAAAVGLLFLNSLAFSQGFTTTKYAGEFLNLGAGARSLAMGDAFVAVATDVSSGYWNPAGLAFLDYPEIMLMHSSQFGEVVDYNFGSFGMPMGKKSSVGLSVLRLGVDDIKRTRLRNPDVPLGDTYVDENGQLVRNTPIEDGVFGASDYAFFFTYSKRTSSDFAFGGNVKFLLRSIDDNSAWGLGFDLGVLFNPVAELVVGVNVQDITSTLLAWDTGRRELITPTIRSGLTYPFAFSGMGGKFQPALDLVIRFENRQESALANLGRASLDLNFGGEYFYRERVALRLGSSEAGEFSAGAGVYLQGLHIDYAFVGHEDLGDTHRVSARLALEQPKFRRPE